MPSGTPITTTKTFEILLDKLPQKARKAFRVPNIPHNLIAASKLCNAGCGVHLYKHHCEVECEGETLYQRWRDSALRLWRMALTSKGGNHITPDTEEEDLQTADGMTMATIRYHFHSVYKCNNKEQLIKYYHSRIGFHPKTTLISAAKSCTGDGVTGLHDYGEWR